MQLVPKAGPAFEPLALSWVVAATLIGLPSASGADEPGLPADPPAQAVIDSLAFPPRTTPAELLDAAIRATDVEAYQVASRYFSRLDEQLKKAAAGRLDQLAELGDSADPGDLRRLERVLGERDETVRPLVQEIREAARARRRDPARLRQAVDELSSDRAATRAAAFDRLARTGVDALPVLVELLQGADPAQERARRLGRDLVRRLGPTARQPLVAWLGSDDVAHWPGIIEALAAVGADDEAPGIAEHLLAPALVPDAPPAARDRARRLLAGLARRGLLPATDAGAALPTTTAAIALVTRRLDRVLSIDGLPAPDHLLMEPVLDPLMAAAAAGKTVERFVWDPEARRLERLNLPPRAARAQEALHLARDLAALGATDPESIRLVLLARLEALLAFTGDPLTALDRVPPDQLQAAVTGPEGFDYEAVADVLEMAATRGMFPTAAAAARTIVAAQTAAGKRPAGNDDTAEPVPLPPAARRALLRALAVPDATLQFEAARALAQVGGDPPYHGSSRVAEILLQAATSTGEEIAVVAHHDAVIRAGLATDLSRHGYRVEQVATGREAILATRASIDTVLVLVGARTVRPTALETVQFIQRQPVGDVPPVLVVVDPLDDDARGKFLTRLILTFSDLDCVGIVDRLDSLFLPRLDPATQKPVGPARFPDHLAQVAGPEAVAPAARQARAAQRRTRAGQSLQLLADLGRRGWDVSAAETTARLALMQRPQPGSPADLFSPAVEVLSTIGSSRAQQALLGETERSDRPPDSRKLALAGFAASVERFGMQLECQPLRAAYARYNQAASSADRALAGAVLDAIETPSWKARHVSADAAHPRPTR